MIILRPSAPKQKLSSVIGASCVLGSMYHLLLLAFCANVMKIDSHLISDRFIYFSKCFAGITGCQIDPINNSFAHFCSLTLTEQWTFSARPSNVTGFGSIFSPPKQRLDGYRAVSYIQQLQKSVGFIDERCPRSWDRSAKMIFGMKSHILYPWMNDSQTVKMNENWFLTALPVLLTFTIRSCGHFFSPCLFFTAKVQVNTGAGGLRDGECF